MHDKRHVDLVKAIEGMDTLIDTILGDLSIQKEREDKLDSHIESGELDLEFVIHNLKRFRNIKRLLFSTAGRLGEEYDGEIGGMTPQGGFVYVCYKYRGYYFVWFDLGHRVDEMIYSPEKEIVFQD